MRTINIDRGWRFQHNAFMLGDELSGKKGQDVWIFPTTICWRMG